GLFVGAYIIFRPSMDWKRITLLLGLTTGLLYLASYYMLQFRTVGLEAYVTGAAVSKGFKQETLFIDNDLPIIGMLTEIFPDRIAYRGSEMLVWALVHPIPRALWPGKPQKLSIEAADALGMRGLSVASTFIGESYMMGGYPAVFLIAFLF